jgi:Ca2+-binding RTX toxin-like protein
MALAAAILLGVATGHGTARAADVDLTGGVLVYTVPPLALANLLEVSLDGGNYTIDDPAESITPSANALAAGCAAVDANTVTCPVAAVASFNVSTGLGADQIDLSGATVPARVQPGDGDDLVVGGESDDTFVWNPGDDNDTLEGGPGQDTLEFNGASVGEQFTITAQGAGFRLFRNVASVTMDATGTETLFVHSFGGADQIFTVGLAGTAQIFSDGVDAQADAITIDAEGGCVGQIGAGVYQVFGLEPITIVDIPTVSYDDLVCGAFVELNAGELGYFATTNKQNALAVSLASGVYTIDDPGEQAITLFPSALDQGCVSLDANTATCPEAAIASLRIDTRDFPDSVDLSGAAVPARVQGGFDVDVLVGGSAGDTFVWEPGGGNDSIDGGPGDDVLEFNGSGANEIIAITADGDGFGLTRNVAAISLAAENVETLDVATRGGDDDVSTVGLRKTVQFITDDVDTFSDSLTVDAEGLCGVREGTTFEIEGRQPIHFANFGELDLIDTFCRVDPCVGAVATAGCTVNGVSGQLCVGTAGDDSIVGTREADVILGGGGRDRIRGGLGSDLVCGEDGPDNLSGAAGDDTLVGGPGDDKLVGGNGFDTLLGGDDADSLSGGGDDDDLDGGRGDDRLIGGADGDTLRGGLGFDRLDGSSGTDACSDADQTGPFPRCP